MKDQTGSAADTSDDCDDDEATYHIAVRPKTTAESGRVKRQRPQQTFTDNFKRKPQTVSLCDLQRPVLDQTHSTVSLWWISAVACYTQEAAGNVTGQPRPFDCSGFAISGPLATLNWLHSPGMKRKWPECTHECPSIPDVCWVGKLQPLTRDVGTRQVEAAKTLHRVVHLCWQLGEVCSRAKWKWVLWPRFSDRQYKNVCIPQEQDECVCVDGVYFPGTQPWANGS